MKPQHLIFSASLIGSADAFVGSSAGAFAPRTSAAGIASAPSATLRMDTEGDSISRAARKSLENRLFNGKLSLDGIKTTSVSSPPPEVDLELAQAKHGMPWVETIGSSEFENPLLYMPFWEWQMDFMGSELSNLRPIEHCDDGSDFGYNENSKKKARIVNHCYASDEYRKIRMSYYDAGDSTQVFNSVWYPDPSYNLPVLGIDLLAFGRKKYLAIVDFQPLYENEEDHAAKFEHILEPIKEEYDSLKGRMSAKFYDETKFFSKQMLFARFEDDNVVSDDLMPAFQRYVQAHLKLLKSVKPDDSLQSQKAVLERQRAYDTYSAERDPAAGLFAAMFGKEWAEDFIFDFLFSLSERKEGGIQIPPMGMMGGGPPPQGGGAPQGAPQGQSAPQPAIRR
uniref:15,16-dihydrobiliverdin:ferredoxin oxidoreductase n=1 Tax=Trieres chinensis TaxID=1514140 RepID=A0A7S1Z3N6_TRICV